MFKSSAFSLCFASIAVFAQAPTDPVVSPRGVINAFTQQPAPSRVAAGGLIWINGLNLGPAQTEVVSVVPWPTKVGNPAVEVLVNGRVAAIYSVSPSRIIAQVPLATAAGLATVQVRKGTVTSKAARIYVDAVRPALRTADDSGYGMVAGTINGSSLKLSATGLGVTDVRVADGDPGAADGSIKPRANVDVWIGGLLAQSTAVLSPDRVGEFDITVQIPDGAQPGDLVSVVAGNTASNRATFKSAKGANVKCLPVPSGAVDFRAITASDLRASYVLANGARDSQGCYAGYLFDFSQSVSTAIDGCLTAANRNAASPFLVSTEGSAVAALVGPPGADPAAGVSANLMVLNPALPGALPVALPSPALTLASAPGGNFSAVLAGTPPSAVTVNSVTGDITAVAAAGGGAGGGAGAGLAALLNANFDLGNGLTHLLAAPVAISATQYLAIIGDDLNKPTAARIATVDAQGLVSATRNFPGGYLPLVAPAPPTVAGAPAQPAARFRISMSTDTVARVLYVLSTQPDGSKHGLTAIPLGNGAIKAIDFPGGWFASACTNNISIFSLELANRLALLGSKTADTSYKTTCPAEGYVTMDLATQQTAALELGGAGQFNAGGGNAASVNDYIYGANTDPQRRGISDTLYVLDGVTNSSFRFDLPNSVTSFSGVTPVPVTGVLLATAANKAVGDAGIVVFDLGSATTKLLPTPDGFASVQLLSIFTTARKIVAKGTKLNNAGSQFLIYDLVSGDLTIVPNPQGVVYVGSVPQVAAGAGQAAVVLQRANTKADAVQAVTYGADRKQNGMMLLSVN